MTGQDSLSFLARADQRVARISDWVQENESRAIIAILSATTAFFFVFGLVMFSNMPLPTIAQ